MHKQQTREKKLTVDGSVKPVKDFSLRLGDNHGRAKVNQLDHKIIVNHNVLVLDVAVADSARVEVVDTLDNLLENHSGLRFRELGMVLDTLKQVARCPPDQECSLGWLV